MFLSRNHRGERRVSASEYKVLLTAHIIVGVGWLGASFAKLVLGLVAVTGSVPEYSVSLFLAMEVLNVAFPPLAIGTILSGTFLSLGTRWGLLEHYWVVTKLVLTVAVITTGVRIGGYLMQQSIAAAPGPAMHDGSMLGLASAPTTLLLALAVAHVLMLAFATVLSVYKPWGQTWFGRRKTLKKTIEQRVVTAHESAARA